MTLLSRLSPSTRLCSLFILTCIFLLACENGMENVSERIHKIAFTDGISVDLTADRGEPSSGEAQGIPEVVYNGRESRLAVTVTDSDTGLPVGGTYVAAKVTATRWIGAPRPLAPVAAQDGTHEGKVELPTRGPYRIDVEVEWPSGRTTVQFGFDY